MKYLILHIGPHKTGSTFLQKMLIKHSQLLLENDIVYPEYDKYESGHFKYVELLSSKKLDEFNQVSNKLNSIDQSVLLSSENFDRLKKEDVVLLRDAFKNRLFKVVFIKRNLDELLVSSWQEEVKHGGGKSWSKYCLDHLLKPYASNVLNQGKILDVYIDVFGEDAVSIINYNEVVDKNGDLFEELLNVIGLNDSIHISKKESINKSMDFSHIEVIRRLNIEFEKNNMKVHHFVREAYLELVKNGGIDGLDFILNKIRSCTETISLSQSFTVKILEKQFFNKYSSIGVAKYDTKKKEYELPNDKWMIDEGVSEFFSKLYDAVRPYYLK